MLQFSKQHYTDSIALMVIVLRHTTYHVSVSDNMPKKPSPIVSIAQHVSAILGETKFTAHSFPSTAVFGAGENNNVFIISNQSEAI